MGQRQRARQRPSPRLLQKMTTWQATLGLFVFLFALFAVTADYSGAERPNDVHWSAIVGWSIAKLGSLDMEKFQLTLLNVRTWLFNVGPLESGSCVSGNAVLLPGSHCRSDRFPGSILLSVPFYFVFGTTKIFAIAPATLSAVTASAGALTFLYRAMLRIVTPAVALGSVFLMAFTTGIWTVAWVLVCGGCLASVTQPRDWDTHLRSCLDRIPRSFPLAWVFGNQFRSDRLSQR